MRMRFKHCRRIAVIATAVICTYDVIYLLGYDIDQNTQQPLRGMIYRHFDWRISQEPIHVQDRIKDICLGIPPDKYSDWTKSPDYIVAAARNLSFCAMHNEMDDIWARIFEIFVNSSKTGDYLKKQFPQLQRNSMVNFEAADRKTSQTVLYVRNPYARLYVLYHDRFHIVTAHTQHKKWCENITFQAFLDKVITHVKLRQDWGTSWFSPLVPKCRLCDIKLSSVIREENFAQDMQDFSHKLFKNDKESIKALEFIQKPGRILIHSLVLAKLNIRNPACRYSQIGPMLWGSLKYMGFVNHSVKYPESLDNVNVAFHPDMLVKAVLKEGNVSLTETEKLAQKKTVLAEAYHDIKEETIEYIQEIYKYEFEMFGYSKTRPDYSKT